MFNRTTLVKFVLAPPAAMTLLAQVTSASPTALQARNDGGFAPDNYHWPPGDDRDCLPDCDRLPKIIKPDCDTVWRVGDRQQVVWYVAFRLAMCRMLIVACAHREKKQPWDDWKQKNDDHDGDKKDDGKHGEDDTGKQDGKDDKDKHDNDHRRPRCKTKLTLRKGPGFRPGERSRHPPVELHGRVYSPPLCSHPSREL